MKTNQLLQLEKELRIETSRSSGPGGQNVNKTESKVMIFWFVASSEAFSEVEKVKIIEKCANKISDAGELIIMSQESRSQLKNKTLALQKLFDLINKSLQIEAPRLPTKVPKAVKIRRFKEKKMMGKTKENRKKIIDF